MKLLKKSNSIIINIIFSIFVTLFFLVVLFIIREIFAHDVSDFTVEILAVVLGAIIVVASTSVIIRLQASQEIEREYSAKVFEKKLSIYLELLNLIFKSDDDNILTREEIQEIENKIGTACLLANANLIWGFSQFVYQLKTYGVMYYRSMHAQQKEHFTAYVNEIQKNRDKKEHKLFKGILSNSQKTLTTEDYFISLDYIIQGIREDLSVVHGDVSKNIEKFVEIPYDHKHMIKNPNNID